MKPAGRRQSADAERAYFRAYYARNKRKIQKQVRALRAAKRNKLTGNESEHPLKADRPAPRNTNVVPKRAGAHLFHEHR